MGSDRFVAYLVRDSVSTAQQRMPSRPAQLFQALDHLVRTLYRTQALFGNARVRHRSLHVYIDVHAAAISERKGETRAELDNPERRLFFERFNDGIRAGVATTSLIVDRPVQFTSKFQPTAL